MCKRVMIGLFTMSVVALVWTDANAGCCCNPRMCASWITGNAICYLKTIGFDPDPITPPQVRCEASGTAGGGNMSVVVTCGPKEGNLDDSVGGDDVRTQQATLPATLLKATQKGFTRCQTSDDGTPTGRCKTFLSLEPSLGSLNGLCKNPDYPTPETATPTEFNAKSCVSEEGMPEKCITYRCVLPTRVVEAAIRLGQSVAYVCIPR